MSKNSIQVKKKSHFRRNICRSKWSPNSAWNNINTEPVFQDRLNKKYETHICTQKKGGKKRLLLSTCRHMFVLATMQMILFVLSPGGLGIRNSSWSERESKRTHVLRRQGTHLSGGVGAGTRAVTPATRRSGARAAACWGSPPWGAGPARIQTFFFFFKGLLWWEGKKNEQTGRFETKYVHAIHSCSVKIKS